MSEKENIIETEKRLKQVKRTKQRTGKSKEYINKLARNGCPNGKKKCVHCSNRGLKTRNGKEKSRKDKKDLLCNCDNNDIKEIREEIKMESEVIVFEKLQK